MALGDLLKGETGKSVAIGVTAAMLAPLVLPILTQTVRPLARTLIKTGIILYHKGRETLAEAEETLDDLVAEAHAELAEEHRHQPQAAQHTASTEDEEPISGAHSPHAAENEDSSSSGDTRTSKQSAI